MRTDPAGPTIPPDADVGLAHPRVYPWIVWLASAATILIAGSALVGWAVGAEGLTRWQSSLFPMEPLAAVGFVLAGAALGLLGGPRPDRRRHTVGRLLAAPVLVLGVLTVGQYALGVSIGVDLLLFPDAVRAAGGPYPGRPALNTGNGLIFVGLALLLLDGQPARRAVLVQLLGLGTLVIALSGLIGYAFGAEAFYAVGPYTPMSLPTSTAYLALALGLLFARPGHGPMAVATRDDFGGYVARRLVAAALLIPFLLNWVRVLGQETGLFGPVYGLTLVILLTMITFSGIAWWVARALHRLDVARRQGEAARAFLAAIVDSSEDGILATDPEGTITAWNRGAERLYGYPAAEVLGRRVSMLVQEERRGEMGALLERLRRGERIEHVDTVWMTRQGRRIHVSLTLSPVRDGAGRISGVSIIARNIGERKRAEEERERLLRRERVAHAETEAARREAERREGEEAALRRAAETLTETFTTEKVFDRIARSALSATDADSTIVERVEPTRGEVEVVAVAGERRFPTGKRLAYDRSLARRVIERGEPLAIDDMGRDPRVPEHLKQACHRCSALTVPLAVADEPIGALLFLREPGRPPFRSGEVVRARTFAHLASLAFHKIRLLAEAEERRRELQRVLNTQSRLVSGFTHDVKNPLGAADGRLALLEEGVLDGLNASQRENLSRVRRSIGTALGLIDDLVDFARAQAGRLELERREVQIAELTREITEEYRPAAEARGLVLREELAEDLPVIESDPDRIRQILGNLLSNAVKYTEEGRITVRAEEREDDRAPSAGRWLGVDVSDTGRGIPEDRYEEIFGEFTRLEPQERRGTGLGLAISRRLARLLGGDVTVESEVGKGSTFTLWLPRDRRRGEGTGVGREWARPAAPEPTPVAADGVGAVKRPTAGGEDTQPTFPAWCDSFLDRLEDYAIFMLDRRGVIVRWNRGAERTTGYTTAEVLGRPFSIFYSEEEATSGKPEEEMRIALETGRYEDERWRLKADGTPFYASEILAPIRDEDGRHVGFGKIFRDLTEQHRAVEAARIAETRLRLALDAGGLGEWELDLKTGASPRRSLRHDRIFGYEAPVEDWSYQRFMEHVHPEDRDDVERRFQTALERGEPWDFECRIHRANGELRWIWAKGSIQYDAAGAPDRAFGVVMDVTDAKRAERALRMRAAQQAAVAELGQRALSGASLDDLFDEAVRLLRDTLDLDYAKVLELLPRRDAFLLRAGVGWAREIVGHATVSTGLESQAGYTLHSKRPVVLKDMSTEERFHGPALLTQHDVKSGMSVLIGNPEHPWGVLGAHTRERRRFRGDDVNFLQAVANVLAAAIDRSRTEEELRAAKEAAEQANRAKSDFLAVMSHELRTPLTAVIGYADILETGLRGPITDPQREDIKRIKASADHLTDLIEEILTFSRLESGREKPRAEGVDVAALARETAGVVEPSARDKGLEFIIRIPDAPVPAETDPGKIRRILLNLLTNAVNFTPEGTVSLEVVPTEDRVVFHVRDTGIGIDPEDMKHIFEPFWQAEAALTREVGGTGLGLTVARRLTRMLGGDIDVESAVGEGSTFTVTLPRRRPNASAPGYTGDAAPGHGPPSRPR